jgi:Lrp/AsnC family leucine-responsive transcriptional regulator
MKVIGIIGLHIEAKNSRRHTLKRVRHINGALDRVDAEILAALAEDGRTALKDIALRVGLSSPSVAERIRRLEEVGIIESYGATLNAQALGFSFMVSIRVRPIPGELQRVSALLASKPEVIECDRVTGDDCFIAKAVVASVADLEKLIDDILPFATTNTALIQSSPVRRRVPPLPRR